MSKPVELGTLKEGNYIILDDEPCKIVEVEHSKPGKHGGAKARVVGIGLFTQAKRTIVAPVDASVQVPLVDRRSAQVISKTGNDVQFMDLEDFRTFDVNEGIEPELLARLAPGVEVEYWLIMGRPKIVRTK
ncbi:MAG: translation initiation factor IF-5A [Thermoprotei archaeon]|nr:translation initiation factor IF-5A [TACK group archaeon]